MLIPLSLSTFHIRRSSPQVVLVRTGAAARKAQTIEFLFFLSSDAREHFRSSFHCMSAIKMSEPQKSQLNALRPVGERPQQLRRVICVPIESMSSGARERLILSSTCSYGSCPRVPPNLSLCHHHSLTTHQLTQFTLHI